MARFSPCIAVVAAFVAVEIPKNILATLTSPPTLVNANPTAHAASAVVSVFVIAVFSARSSQIPFIRPATVFTVGAKVSPTTSCKSPHALAACFNLPSKVFAAASACAKPDAESS